MNKNRMILLLLGILLMKSPVSAQTPVDYTANHKIAEYDGYFCRDQEMLIKNAPVR